MKKRHMKKLKKNVEKQYNLWCIALKFFHIGVTYVPLAVCRIPTDDTLAIWPTWDRMKTKVYSHSKTLLKLGKMFFISLQKLFWFLR